MPGDRTRTLGPIARDVLGSAIERFDQAAAFARAFDAHRHLVDCLVDEKGGSDQALRRCGFQAAKLAVELGRDSFQGGRDRLPRRRHRARDVRYRGSAAGRDRRRHSGSRRRACCASCYSRSGHRHRAAPSPSSATRYADRPPRPLVRGGAKATYVDGLGRGPGRRAASRRNPVLAGCADDRSAASGDPTWGQCRCPGWSHFPVRGRADSRRSNRAAL